jgi:hypothetical protein
MATSEGRGRPGAADVVALLYLLVLALVLLAVLGLVGPRDGRPTIIGDFTVFWTAGRAVAAGQAPAVYDAGWFLDFAG